MPEPLPASEIPAVSYASQRPEWIRLPKQQRKGAPPVPCAITGLHRATLIDLCVKSRRNSWNPPVRSKLIKKKGSKRGIRLIHVASLLKWIDDQPDEDTRGD